MDEVRRLGSLKDSAINEAKKVLAYEVTKLVHGEEEAEKVKQAAEALFGGGGAMTDVPTVNLIAEQANAKQQRYFPANAKRARWCSRAACILAILL